MEAQTGQAAFGDRKYGVLTKLDSVRLVRMAIKGAIAHPEEGYAMRQLIRRMMPMIGIADAVMLAQVCLGATVQTKEWAQLAADLNAKTGD